MMTILCAQWCFYLGVGALGIHLVDRAIRFYRGTLPVAIRSMRVLPAGQDRCLVEMRLHAPHIHFEAGSYIFLNIPGACFCFIIVHCFHGCSFSVLTVLMVVVYC
jgi:hypothetical protein